MNEHPYMIHVGGDLLGTMTARDALSLSVSADEWIAKFARVSQPYDPAEDAVNVGRIVDVCICEMASGERVHFKAAVGTIDETSARFTNLMTVAA